MDTTTTTDQRANLAAAGAKFREAADKLAEAASSTAAGLFAGLLRKAQPVTYSNNRRARRARGERFPIDLDSCKRPTDRQGVR